MKLHWQQHAPGDRRGQISFLSLSPSPGLSLSLSLSLLSLSLSLSPGPGAGARLLADMLAVPKSSQRRKCVMNDLTGTPYVPAQTVISIWPDA